MPGTLLCGLCHPSAICFCTVGKCFVALARDSPCWEHLTIFLFFPIPGLKALALLGVLPDGDSTSENPALPVTVSFHASEEQLEKKTAQLAKERADASLFVPCNVSNVSTTGSQLAHKDAHQGRSERRLCSFGLYSVNRKTFIGPSTICVGNTNVKILL